MGGKQNSILVTEIASALSWCRGMFVPLFKPSKSRKNSFFAGVLTVMLMLVCEAVWGQTQTFDTPGTYTFTVPAGVTSITIECWGAGGAGGGAYIGAGGGGGGGAYNKGVFNVSPNQKLTVTVGAGGIGVNGENGVNGGTTTVSGSPGTISANGGSGGEAGYGWKFLFIISNDYGTGGAGGAGGSYAGGTGGTANGNGAGGGGGAGNAQPGNAGSNTQAGAGGSVGGGKGGDPRTSNNHGNPGSAPGGGGGGARSNSDDTPRSGGAGAAGQVVISLATKAPTCTSNPSNQSVCAGSSASFTGVASSYNQPTVSWEISTSPNNWLPLTIASPYSVSPNWDSGTNTSTSTLTISPVSINMNGYQYRVKFTNNKGDCTTDPATLSVTTTLSTVNITPIDNQGICVNGTGSQLTVSETGGGTITGRQWGKRATSGGTIDNIWGATGDTYTPTVSDLGIGTWYVVCTSTPTCGSATVSNEVTVTVNPLPTVSIGDPLTAICQGGTTAALGGSFGGGATGAVWSDNLAGGTFANNDGTTPAATTYTASSTYSSPVTLTLTSSGGSCGIASYSKQLTVNPTPVINNSSTYNICSGESANISLTATTSSTFSWSIGTITGTFENPQPVSGFGPTIDQTLSIPNNATTGSVEYVVTPTSTAGSCVGASFPITVTVEHPAIGSFE